MKLKINTKDWSLYMILIPFLHPRGFSEYIPVYKNFFTIWLYGAIICIFLLFIFENLKYKVSRKIYNYWLILYFAVMCILTFAVQKSFAEGLQKTFAVPALCILCAIYFKKNPKNFIRSVNNLLIIVFLLNLTVFNPLLWKQYFNPITNHITFLGHVQINAQIGIVGVLFAYLEYSIYLGNKKRFFWQVILSIGTMISAFTSAAYIALIFLTVFWILKKMKVQKIFILSGKTYAFIYLLFNVLLFWFVIYKGNSFSIVGFSLSGREFIWREAFNSFFKSPIYGYGVQGVLIKVFWSTWVGDGEGMNYMHNQILQVLNDGGIILFIPYVCMIFSGMQNLDKLQKGQLKFWSIICMMIILIVMTFESTMEYFYVFFIFMAIAYLPEIQNEINSNYLIGEE